MTNPLKHFNPDVVVIGSGPGGGTAAWRLIQHGYKVLILEAGPKYTPTEDYRLSSSNWEQPFPKKEGSIAPYEVSGLQNIEKLDNQLRSWNQHKGYLFSRARRTNIGYHHVRGAGGSSLHFTGEAHRLNPRSMSMDSQFNVAADWPISYKELEPYYQIAEQIVGVAGPDIDQHSPRLLPYSQPAHANSYAAQVLAEAATKLGHHPQANSLAILSKPYDGRPACNYCGGCQRGCQPSDKGSIDVTYLKHALKSKRCFMLTEAEVLKIGANKDTVTDILFSYQSTMHNLSVKLLVLSAGAIQSPKLLLNSFNVHHNTVLANRSGQFGKNFMETLLTTVSALHPEQLGSHRGLPVNWVSWRDNDPEAIPGVIGGCRFGPSMAESDLVGPVAYANRVVPGWGLAHKSAMRNTFGRVLSITAIGESLPHPDSYVDLSEKVDQFSLPLPGLHSYLDKNAISRLKYMRTECEKILTVAGCALPFEVFSSADAFSSTHVFGTCRIGLDPMTSVCNAYGQAHDLNNLYCCDASVFPSSGGGESPGLTIQALAIRAADHIKGLV